MATKVIKVPKGFEFPGIANFGIIDSIIMEQRDNLDCVAGTNDLSFTPVPAGKIHIIQSVLAIATIGTPSVILIGKMVDESWHYCRRKVSPQTNEEVINQHPLILNEGNYVLCQFQGMNVDDDIHAGIMGYQIDKS